MDDPTLKNETGIMQMLRSPVWLKVGPLLFFTVLFVLYFSPVLFADSLLGYSDAVFYSIPNFYSPRTLWTNLLFSGFPVAADPQAQTWYPLAFLFSSFPHSWNAYIISAYVLSACFMFGYVWTVTRSRMAGLVAGIGYSMCGFMIGRLGQVPLIHSAVWLPLIFIALEKTRQQVSAGWTAIGSLAIACSFLGGHPQIIFMGLVVAGAYVVYMGWRLENRRWTYLGNFVWMVLVGMGLIGIQLLPTMELADWSARVKLSYEEFVRFSLSPRDILTMLFPYLFGAVSPFYDTPFFNEGNGMELPGYLGLFALLLACLAVAGSGSNRVVRFWLITALIAFVMALGKYTPVGEIMFHLPGFNKFRAPVRHFLEISLAVSILAGFGVDSIQRGKISAGQMKKVLLGAAGLFGLAFSIIWIYAGTWEKELMEIGRKPFGFISWENKSLWIPVFVMILGVSSLVVWFKRPESPVRRFLILTVLVVDLASYGWFHHWRYFVPPEQWIQPPETARQYRNLLNKSHQRLVQAEGLHSERETFPVNTSRLWGLPSATGYNPLIISRVRKILSISEPGVLLHTWASVQHRAFDIFGVRYLIIPQVWRDDLRKKSGIEWAWQNLGIRLGNGCDQSYPSSIEFAIPQGFSANRIGIVSKSYCTEDIPDGSAVMSIRLSGGNNLKQETDFVIGRHTAEWGYDCNEIQDQVRHKQPSVFQTFSIKSDSGVPCHGFQYVANMPIRSNTPIRRMHLEWMGGSGVVQLDKITLIDEKSGRSFPLREVTASDHWRFKEQIGESIVYENLDAMPRAWLVPEAVPARPQDILHAIYHSRLPDGRSFDPAKTALIEKSNAFQATSFDPSGKVDVVQLEDTEIVLQTQSTSDSFLVTSDIYYPGWEATIDGQPAPLVLTDYVLRGISLPAGSHEVRFEYHPKSFYIGMTVTVLSLLILILWVFRSFHRNHA